MSSFLTKYIEWRCVNHVKNDKRPWNCNIMLEDRLGTRWGFYHRIYNNVTKLYISHEIGIKNKQK